MQTIKDYFNFRKYNDGYISDYIIDTPLNNKTICYIHLDETKITTFIQMDAKFNNLDLKSSFGEYKEDESDFQIICKNDAIYNILLCEYKLGDKDIFDSIEELLTEFYKAIWTVEYVYSLDYMKKHNNDEEFINRFLDCKLYNKDEYISKFKLKKYGK